MVSKCVYSEWVSDACVGSVCVCVCVCVCVRGRVSGECECAWSSEWGVCVRGRVSVYVTR